MTTSRLLHERMREKGYSKIRLQNELGCCEKTLRNYLNGTTTSGPYAICDALADSSGCSLR